jgi:dihydrolipoamide dehydrogenase
MASERHIEAKNVIVATGSIPIEIPRFEFDGNRVITPTEALDLDPLPKSMAIIGGGVSGMELGMLYARLGVRISIIEMMDDILPGFDPDLVRAISRSARKAGIDIHTSAKAKYIRGNDVIAVRNDGSEVAVPGEKVFVVVGRMPNTKDLGLDTAGVRLDAKGFVPVDEQCRTNVPHIYAIGDITGLPMLAHKATYEGLIAAEAIAGHPSCSRTDCVIPGVVFTEPELVTVGMTEPEAQAKGIAYVSGKFPFSALGRSLATGSMDGFVKVLAEAESHKIIGMHIAGASVSDLAGECTLAILKRCTLEEVASTVHAHPTFAEGIMEACEVALGRAIHVLNSR